MSVEQTQALNSNINVLNPKPEKKKNVGQKSKDASVFTEQQKAKDVQDKNETVLFEKTEKKQNLTDKKEVKSTESKKNAVKDKQKAAEKVQEKQVTETKTVQKAQVQKETNKEPVQTAQTAQATQGKQEQDKKTSEEKKTIRLIKTASGLEEQGIGVYRDEKGVTHYYNAQTNEEIVGEQREQIVEAEASAISEALYEAAEGAGTDEELLKQGIKGIYSREILARVNQNLAQRDDAYANNKDMMPVEALISGETSGSDRRQLLNTLISSGSMTAEEQANTVKRELDNVISGGTYYTSVKEVMHLVKSPEARLALEEKIKNDKNLSGLKPDEGSYIRAYIKDDGFKPKEVDMLDLELMKTGAYKEAEFKKDANGKPVLNGRGRPIIENQNDQAHRDDLIRRCVFEYNDKETLNKGLASINSNPDSPDYQVLELYSRHNVVQDKNGNYPERFKGQDYVQRYLAGFHSDKNGKVDVGALSASNTLLYKGEKPSRIKAEEALYNAKNGDFGKTFDSMEPETYAHMAEMIKNGDIKGVRDMNDLYNKALKDVNLKTEKVSITANAMISGQIEFDDKKKADFCIELMHSIDENRGHGGSSGVSASFTNAADYQTEQLKVILQNNPQIINDVKARVEKEDFFYTTIHGQNQVITTSNTNTKDEYKAILAETKYIAKDEIFLDSKGNKITDPKEIEKIKAANSESLTSMREYVALLEREHKKQVDSEGILSDMANGLSSYSGLGTDREDVATEYRNAKLLLSQLEAASQGKLRDSEGNVVSMQDLAQQTIDKEKKLAETNGDYNTTIAYGKTAIMLAPVIAVTWGAGAVVASTGGVTATAVSMAAADGIAVPTAAVSVAATAESILIPAAAAGSIVTIADVADSATSNIGLTIEKKEEAAKNGNKVAVETAAFIAAGKILSFVSDKITGFLKKPNGSANLPAVSEGGATPHSVPTNETLLIEYHPSGAPKPPVSGTGAADVPALPKPPAQPPKPPVSGTGAADVPALPKPPAQPPKPPVSGSADVPALPKPPAQPPKPPVSGSADVPAPAPKPEVSPVPKPSFSWEFTIPDYTENLPDNTEEPEVYPAAPSDIKPSFFGNVKKNATIMSASKIISDAAGKVQNRPLASGGMCCVPQSRGLDMFAMMNMMNRAMMQRYNNYMMMQRFMLMMIFVMLYSYMNMSNDNDYWF